MRSSLNATNSTLLVACGDIDVSTEGKVMADLISTEGKVMTDLISNGEDNVADLVPGGLHGPDLTTGHTEVINVQVSLSLGSYNII